MAQNGIQIALCADTAFLKHAWIAMASAIEQAAAPVSVHLLGDGLASGAVERLSAACRELADARLVHHDVTEMLAGARLRGGSSRTTMGRLFLPQLVEGRVLYLDADTLTCADISPLFGMDMGTAKVAAVRDYTVLGTFRKGPSVGQSVFADQIDLMRPLPVFMYFNAGVVLMDCSAIRRDGEIMRRMADVSAVSGFRLLDQDMLNSAFKNQVHFLDHSWNCMWGQSRRMARIARNTLPECPDRHPLPAKIVHFIGSRKPWDPLGSWCLSMSGVKMLPAVYRYRMAERRLSKFLAEAGS